MKPPLVLFQVLINCDQLAIMEELRLSLGKRTDLHSVRLLLKLDVAIKRAERSFARKIFAT